MIFGAEYILKQVRRITEIRTVKGSGQVCVRKFEGPYVVHFTCIFYKVSDITLLQIFMFKKLYLLCSTCRQ